MKVEPEDFRRYYSELSDAALLSLPNNELTDTARQCYESEVAHRRLPAPASQSSLATVPEDQSADGVDPVNPFLDVTAAEAGDLVTLAAFNILVEATLAQSLLKSAGIPSLLSRADDVSWLVRNYRLLVPAPLLQDGLQILRTHSLDDGSQAEPSGVAMGPPVDQSGEEQSEDPGKLPAEAGTGVGAALAYAFLSLLAISSNPTLSIVRILGMLAVALGLRKRSARAGFAGALFLATDLVLRGLRFGWPHAAPVPLPAGVILGISLQGLIAWLLFRAGRALSVNT